MVTRVKKIKNITGKIRLNILTILMVTRVKKIKNITGKIRLNILTIPITCGVSPDV